MKNLFCVPVFLLGMLLFDVPGYARQPEPYRQNRTVYLGLNISAPFYYRPFEYGASLTCFLQENRWGITIDYRKGIATRIHYPDDYHYIPEQSLLSLDWNVLPSVFQAKSMPEKIRTIAVRAVYQRRLYKKLQWALEAGPAYMKYDKIIFTLPHVYTTRNYELSYKTHHLPGLSLINKLYFPSTKWMNVHLFMHNNINSRFSYTSIGVSFLLGNHKL